MPIDVRLEFVIRADVTEELVGMCDGDLSLAVASKVMPVLPEGMEWVDRRASLVGIYPTPGSQ